MSSISLTTSTVGSEVGVRGHRVRAWPLCIRISEEQDMTYGLYNPQKHVEVMFICE